MPAQILAANFSDHILFEVEGIDDYVEKRSLERTRIKSSLSKLGREVTEKIAELDCSECTVKCLGREIVFEASAAKAELLAENGIKQAISLVGSTT